MNDPITIFQETPVNARISKLVEAFETKYASKPTFITRAPGRVSIIGEHIDYAGLSVLPTAIDRDVLMACHASAISCGHTSKIQIANMDEAKFPAEEMCFMAGKEGPKLDPSAHSWVNYFKASTHDTFAAGLKGVLGQFSVDASSQLVELQVMTAGNVPPAGGLSSSAAMVVSSALAVLQAYNALQTTTQGELAKIAIESERLVGVFSGGMDQSASIFSKRNFVLNVGFVPKLVATLVPFPSGTPSLSIVIANTLVVSEKQKTSKYNYNLRVVEMRVVAALLAKSLDLDIRADLPTAKHIMDAYFTSPLSHPPSIDFLQERQRRLGIMLSVVENVFGSHKENDDWSEIYERLDDITPEQFKQRFHPTFDIEAGHLKLYKRAKHAYSEARRVYQFRSLLERAKEHDTVLGQELGDLMNDSQSSCRDLFECSCPEIDEMCRLARMAGSLGSRLSGAGWGGCTVHLVPQDMESSLIEKLKKDYYAKNFPDLSEEELRDAIFATRPAEGACIYIN